MNRTEKQTQIDQIKDSFLKSKASFFADYKGLTVEQTTELRRRLRKHGTKVKVIKNNLARIAIKEAKLGSEPEQMLDTVVGPTMVAFCEGDPAAVAKEIKKFADENEIFSLKESLLGVRRLSPTQVEELSKLPSREVLLAKMLGSLNAPITNFVGVLAAVPRSFVQVLSAIETKKKEQA
ncbi:MAG: 50S ribosomal protein L10 [Bacteriovoracia bacterium]